MANYHKRNSIRAVQWAPENAQSFEDIKKLIAENPGIGWKADNIVRNDASDNIIIRSFGMIVLRSEWQHDDKKLPMAYFDFGYSAADIKQLCAAAKKHCTTQNEQLPSCASCIE